nr:ATP-binding cassette domain-containing protein [Sporichthya sp.]
MNSTSFVGQIDSVCRQLSDLQAGLGALQRLRSMLEAETEPVGGRSVPPGPVGVSVRGLHFAYPQGSFGLRDIDLVIPAGSTLALDAPTRTPLKHLQLDDLTVVHPDGTIGVRGVSFTIQRGQVVMLVGSVGSGKSSLLASLAGLVHTTARFAGTGRTSSTRRRF